MHFLHKINGFTPIRSKLLTQKMNYQYAFADAIRSLSKCSYGTTHIFVAAVENLENIIFILIIKKSFEN